jgi:beta-lactam-binding protein with PASTA domain
MSIKTQLLTLLVIAALAYATGRYLQPAKVEVKQVEVVKEVEVIKRDVRTVIKEVERPDGTREKETVIEDRTRERTKKESETQTHTVVTNLKPQWKVQGLVQLNNIQQPTYGVGVERRIIGPVFVGAWGKQSREFGLSVSLEF